MVETYYGKVYGLEIRLYQPDMLEFQGRKQRYPTHSPLATCGKWPLKCGKWLYLKPSPNLDVLGKATQNLKSLYLIYTFNTSKGCESTWLRIQCL